MFSVSIVTIFVFAFCTLDHIESAPCPLSIPASYYESTFKHVTEPSRHANHHVINKRSLSERHRSLLKHHRLGGRTVYVARKLAVVQFKFDMKAVRAIMESSKGHHVLPQMALSLARLRVFHRPKRSNRKSKKRTSSIKKRNSNSNKRRIKRALQNSDQPSISGIVDVESSDVFRNRRGSPAEMLITHQRLSKKNLRSRQRKTKAKNEKKNKRKRYSRRTKVRISVRRQLEVRDGERKNGQVNAYDPRLPSPDILDSRVILANKRSWILFDVTRTIRKWFRETGSNGITGGAFEIWAETIGGGYKSVKGVRNIVIESSSKKRKKLSPAVDLYVDDES